MTLYNLRSILSLLGLLFATSIWGQVANMALIPAGNFTMGDVFAEGNTNEMPTHIVYVSAFYMDKFEVTKAMWEDVRQWSTNHGYDLGLNGAAKGANHPVQMVSWYDCVKWCNARSEKDGKIPAYYTDDQTNIYRTGRPDVENIVVKWNTGYRLPTEAEWEKAARGGLNGKRFSWGDTITHSNSNYNSSANDSFDTSSTRGFHPNYTDRKMPCTSPVGSFAANGYGLYDTEGNVYEWCWDRSGNYDSATQANPRGPASGSRRIRRGGSWMDIAWFCRIASRSGSDPSRSFDALGFRCVLPSSQ